MLAPITSYNTPLCPAPKPKSRLLLVTDSPERLKTLKAGLAESNFEITCACSVDELRAACRNHHDLAIVDVEATHVQPMLSTLRSSAGHKTIMTLVESSRLSKDQPLAGLLPSFRAMACNQVQMAALVELFIAGGKRTTVSHPVLL